MSRDRFVKQFKGSERQSMEDFLASNSLFFIDLILVYTWYMSTRYSVLVAVGKSSLWGDEQLKM